MDTLTLRHTAESGTVLLNTTKGDGAADALRAAGFRCDGRVTSAITGHGMSPTPETERPLLGLLTATPKCYARPGSQSRWTLMLRRAGWKRQKPTARNAWTRALSASAIGPCVGSLKPTPTRTL